MFKSVLYRPLKCVPYCVQVYPSVMQANEINCLEYINKLSIDPDDNIPNRINFKVKRTGASLIYPRNL
jgi:hypothetical protein